MTASQGAGYGAAAGMVLGSVSSVIGLRSQNKAVLNQIRSEGNMLAIQTKMINRNREQLDRELGDILSANALATAKNMATAKVLMSTSGTVGGTTKQVSKQAYIDNILADADEISKARNTDMALMNQQLSNQINFRNRAGALKSQIKSPMEGMLGTLMSALGGAQTGASLGSAAAGAMSVDSGAGAKTNDAKLFNTGTSNGSTMNTNHGYGFRQSYISPISAGSDASYRPSYMPRYSPYEG